MKGYTCLDTLVLKESVQFALSKTDGTGIPWRVPNICHAVHTCLQTPLGPSKQHFLCCWSCGSECHTLSQSHISSARCHRQPGAGWNKQVNKRSTQMSDLWDNVRVTTKGYWGLNGLQTHNKSTLASKQTFLIIKKQEKKKGIQLVRLFLCIQKESQIPYSK